MNDFLEEGRLSEESRAATEAVIVDILESRVCQVIAVLVLVAFVASYFTRLPVPALAMLAIDAAIARPVEAGASVSGVLGALLLATRSKWAGWGFVAFLASNAGWLGFAWVNGYSWMFWQQIAFGISSILGVWVWLLKRRSDAGAPEVPRG